MKTLIISHVPITSYNNMGKTFASLFSEFKKEEICQLYIRPTVPNLDICNSYYRIADSDLLKAFPFRYASGKRVNVDENDVGEIKDEINENEFVKSNNRKPYRLILRDLLWKVSKWDNEDFWEWISEEKPDIIFLAPGRGKFLYDIGVEISNHINAPLVIYICDEYYFFSGKASIMKKIQVAMLRKKIRDTIKKATYLVTICDQLSNSYTKEFNIPSCTIMTGSSILANHHLSQAGIVEKPESISYFGNLSYNRFLSIREIGIELDSINSEESTNYRLLIYTQNSSENQKRMKDYFGDIKSIKYCGFFIGDSFYDKLLHSEILLHVESFDEYNVNLVKNSISTKIADSLASGVCLFAYGPREVASIDHLCSKECAFVVSDKRKLRETLIDCFTDKNKRAEIINRALRVSSEYHDEIKNSNRLHELLEDCCVYGNDGI